MNNNYKPLIPNSKIKTFKSKIKDSPGDSAISELQDSIRNTRFHSWLDSPLHEKDHMVQFNQIKYIKQNYTIIDPIDLLDITNFNKNYAILTFDDGLLDHYNISSILLGNKTTGTFLIPSEDVIIDPELPTVRKVLFS